MQAFDDVYLRLAFLFKIGNPCTVHCDVYLRLTILEYLFQIPGTGYIYWRLTGLCNYLLLYLPEIDSPRILFTVIDSPGPLFTVYCVELITFN